MNDRLEVRKPEHKTTVRIVAQTPSGKTVLLEKNARSHNPGMFEYPGGVVHGRKKPPLEMLRKIAAKEFQEETDIAIDPDKLIPVDSYAFYFHSERGKRRLFRRDAHIFRYQLDTENPKVLVNKTRTKQGGEEDFHASWRLVPRDELTELARTGKLLGNTRPKYVR